MVTQYGVSTEYLVQLHPDMSLPSFPVIPQSFIPSATHRDLSPVTFSTHNPPLTESGYTVLPTCFLFFFPFLFVSSLKWEGSKQNYIAWFMPFFSFSWCLPRDKSYYFALNPHLTCWSQCQWLWGPMACESFYPGHWLFAQIWVSGPFPSASSQASAGAKQLGSLGVVAGDSLGQWH